MKQTMILWIIVCSRTFVFRDSVDSEIGKNPNMYEGSGAEGAATTTRAVCIRVVEDKTSPHDLVLEINFGAIEVQVRLRVTDDSNREIVAIAFSRISRMTELPGLVGVLLDLGQVEQVAESAASSTLHADSKADDSGIQVLLANDVIDFTSCGFGHFDWHCMISVVRSTARRTGFGSDGVAGLIVLALVILNGGSNRILRKH